VRTTITLDPEVEALIRATMKERGLSFKETVNSAIRAGLTGGKTRKRRFVQPTFSMGAEQNFRWDKALAAAEALEDEELSRKLSMRK
jgi:Arc/MetJ family transcription regulator